MANSRQQKLNKVIEFFLEDDDFDFYNAYTYPNKTETGYYLKLESEDLNFTTFLDDIYIDNSTVSGIIEIVKSSLDQYTENNGENVST